MNSAAPTPATPELDALLTRLAALESRAQARDERIGLLEEEWLFSDTVKGPSRVPTSTHLSKQQRPAESSRTSICQRYSIGFLTRRLPRISRHCCLGRRKQSSIYDKGTVMGRGIVRVPPDFKHPTDTHGHFIPGAHHEVLYAIDPRLRIAYQIYENVTEGSPVSPIFNSVDELASWLVGQGFSREAADAFTKQGFAPSFVIRSDGKVESGIEGSKPKQK